MTVDLEQDRVNRTEWEKDENWRVPRYLAVYVSKKDTRAWVPKRIPWMGWTLNFGHKAAWGWLIALVTMILSLMISFITVIGRMISARLS